jgi:hypothetical protein
MHGSSRRGSATKCVLVEKALSIIRIKGLRFIMLQSWSLFLVCSERNERRSNICTPYLALTWVATLKGSGTLCLLSSMFSRLFSSKPKTNQESEQVVTAGRSPSPSTESASVSASAATGAPGSPTRVPLPPSHSPSPEPDPTSLHSLVTTCPPKTLYAYTLSRLELGKANFIRSSSFQLMRNPVGLCSDTWRIACSFNIL